MCKKRFIRLFLVFNLTLVVSGFAQLPVTRDLALHLDSTGIIETEIEGEMLVTAWNDVSGNGHAAEYVEGLTLPQKIVNPVNGLAMVQFDTSDRLFIDTDANSLSPASGDMTIIVAGQLDVALPTQFIIRKNNAGSNSEGWNLMYVDTNQMGFRINADGINDLDHKAYVYFTYGESDQMFMFCGMADYDSVSGTGQISVWLDGSTDGSTVSAFGNEYTGTINPDSNVYIGNPFAGVVAEIIIYQAALTPGELDQVYSYLSNKHYIDTPYTTGCVSAVLAKDAEDADINLDCRVDMTDFILLAEKWLLDYTPVP